MPKSDRVKQMEQDTRNVVDEYKGRPIEEMVADLDARGINLEIAIDNVSRDYNMGTIVRSANAFGVRHIHIIGSRQWNKRGAMMTDKYLHVHYHATAEDFATEVKGKVLVAVDNIAGAESLVSAELPRDCVLVFGAEGPGVSAQTLELADKIVEIEQLGSTRSINVGVAAGIVMYEWLRRNHLAK